MADRTKIRWNGWGWTAHKDELAGREAVWKWLAGELGMPALLATPARSLEEIALPAPRIESAQRNAIGAIVGSEQVRDDAHERAFHALGRSYHDLLRMRAGAIASAPDLVVYPRATSEVLSLLRFASEFGVAVVPF